ncbi:MAG: hypothetical protein IT560_12585 [Alphaproteobacteria bacterium]|nr:hypothetical protein [Alphaproteobacteria bacterium]
MTTDAKNIFSDMFNDAALTAEQRAEKMAAAIDDLLADCLPGASKVQELEPYYQFKRPITARYKALDDQARKIRESSLVTRVEPMAAEAAAYKTDDDVSENAPLRVKSAALRLKLAEERKILADMSAPNTELTAVYTSILAAEEKAAHLPSIIVEESRAVLRFLGNTRDPAFYANIQDSVEAILNNIDKQLDTIAGQQQARLERKMFHKYLDAGLTTGTRPLTVPTTARFSKAKVSP